jgi:DNA topoisomerase-2
MTETKTVIRLKSKPKLQVKAQAQARAPQHGVKDSDTESNLSYLGKTIEETYQNKELRDHILSDPDTYAGSIDPQEEEVWIYDTEAERMIKTKITFRECFYKLFDEVLVNAIDHHHRIAGKMEVNPDLKPVKKISVVIDDEKGTISVENDGEGLDVASHEDFGCHVPQVVFGHLLTSVNYDKSEERTIGGKNGYGAKIANIFSKEFTVETVDWHRKLKYTQTWRDNMTVVEDPIIEKYTKVPYTKITYTPDYARFDVENPAVLGDWHMLRKRVYDASACTASNVSVHLNGKKIKVKGFEDYINLYIGRKSETKRVYQEVNDRWQVGICLSPNGEFDQVSLVNGICTDRGGRHVNHIMDNLSKKVIASISASAKKKGVVIQPQFIKKNLFLFLKATVVNPKFDTQTKRKLVSLVKDFGSRCELDDDYVSKVIKLGILDRARQLAEFKMKQGLSKETDGKPRSQRVFYSTLVDAKDAGGPRSNKCTIVFTEGDSAATFMGKGMKGIPESEHRYWGWVPLRGKPLNVCGATVAKLSKNEEIKMIKKVIGLQEGKDYSKSIDGLRYHRIMVLTDADDDGYHIKGLVMNYIGHYWPSLLKHEGFVCDFATPIKKAFKCDARGKRIKEFEFYSEGDYQEWSKSPTAAGKWELQYYKGLGGYEPGEARKFCKEMRTTVYSWNSNTVETESGPEEASRLKFDLAFQQGEDQQKEKYSDKRKQWLNNGEEPTPIIPRGSKTIITYDNFIDNRLKLFSIADNIRSITNLYDGFKPSQRKVLFSCFKRKLTSRIKVEQLSGYISENCSYHHGAASLIGTIVNMAQDYTGSNNVNLLYPSGGFGSRMGGGTYNKKGEDAAQPRYAHTFLSGITMKLFNEHDFPLLQQQEEEGLQIEPKYYVPVLPVVLINGCQGIGTGYSTSVDSYNIIDIAANVKACMNGEPMTEMMPWYKGYNGKIVKTGDNAFITVGSYHRLGPNKIRVTELPVGAKNCKSFKAYVDFLNGLLDDDVAKKHGIKKKKKTDDDTSKSSTFKGSVIHDYEIVKQTDTDFVIDIEFNPGVLDKELENNEKYQFEKKIKIAFTFSRNNMHLYIDDGTIKKFDDPRDIITEFCCVRLNLYTQRKERLLAKHDLDIGKANSKYRFIVAVMDDELIISRKKRTVVEKMLEEAEPPYPKYTNKIDDAEEKAGYQYLLGMQISSFTEEMLEKLKKAVEAAQAQKDKLEGMTEIDIWEEDLDALMKEYEEDTKDWYERNEMTEQRKIVTPALKRTAAPAPALKIKLKKKSP